MTNVLNKSLVLATCIGMSACSAQIDDLIVYTDNVKAKTNVSIEEYPEFKQLQPVNYTASNLRSPFQRLQQGRSEHLKCSFPTGLYGNPEKGC